MYGFRLLPFAAAAEGLFVVFIAVGFLYRGGCLGATPSEEGKLAKHATTRSEHLSASLCASFYLQERGQRLPTDLALRYQRCNSKEYNHHGNASDTAIHGPLKSRSSFREASARHEQTKANASPRRKRPYPSHIGIHFMFAYSYKERRHRPLKHPLFGLVQDLAELRRQQGFAKAALKLIVAWIPECLQSLPQKLPPALVRLSESDAVPLQVFGEKDTALHGRKVLLRGGVYMQDRVGENELQKDSTRRAVSGRHLALWLFARALGLHAKLGLSISGCLANCRDRLRKKYSEGPSMRAAYYGTLSMDILKINKFGGSGDVSSLNPPGFLPHIRSVAEKLSSGSDEMAGALADTILAALACVNTVSSDRRIDLHQPSFQDSQLKREPWTKPHQQLDEGMQKGEEASNRIPKTPSGLLGDPFQMRQWYLHSFFGNFTVGADRAWQKLESTKNANPTVLAVLDTGCYLHQDFIDGFDIANSIFWDNAGEADCTDGIDDDGNGYIDDCFGWNFVEDNAYPFTDDTGHGTLVTSVAAARAHDGRGGRGVLSNPTVMCLRVGSGRGVWTSATIPALDYAIKMKARVSNHSYGGPGLVAAEYEAIVMALTHDHLIVTAAGNSGCNVDLDDGCLFTPGAFRLRGLVNVMASDISGFRAPFSNYGRRSVDVAAPGTLIYAGTNYRPNSGNRRCTSYDLLSLQRELLHKGSCWRHSPNGHTTIALHSAGSGYTYCDGTSFAAPIVAGMAVSLWRYFEATKPIGWQHSTERASRKVEQAIMYSVTGSPALAGALGTNGVINMWRAMRYYDEVPGPFTPEFPTPDRGYDPNYNGVAVHCTTTVAALVLSSLVPVTAAACLI